MITWLKKFGLKYAIREMDVLEPMIAEKLKEAQSKLGSIPPDQFAKTLVDDIQIKLCKQFEIDPKSLGLEA